jgi:hypothetical protein
MHVFLAGEGSAMRWVWDAHVPRRLMTYYYHGHRRSAPTDEVWAMAGKDMFLDSGAYSAYTKSERIDLASYIDFVKETRDLWRLVAALDVIGDHEATWRNYLAMRDAGLDNVLPTFHYGEPWSMLEEMLSVAPYMAFGGLVGASEGAQRAWLDDVWNRAVDPHTRRPRIGVHGFGMTTIGLMLRYPWASVDSTSWLMGSIYGGCVLYVDGQLTRLKFSEKSPERYAIDGVHYDSLCLVPDDPRKRAVDAALEALGTTAEECRVNYRMRARVNAHTYQQFEGRAPTVFVPPQPRFAFE